MIKASGLWRIRLNVDLGFMLDSANKNHDCNSLWLSMDDMYVTETIHKPELFKLDFPGIGKRCESIRKLVTFDLHCLGSSNLGFVSIRDQ